MKQIESSEALLATVLPFWFGDIAQDRPFDISSIQMQRWYGKSADICPSSGFLEPMAA
jgi:hypothetical protein